LILGGAAHAKPVSKHGTGNASTQEAQTPPPKQTGPAEIRLTPDDLGRIARTLEAEKTEADSTKEQERADRNLKAQENMAFWAELMFGVGVFELCVTLLGVVLVFLTLRETRRIGEAQVRAYLHITQMTITFRVPDGHPSIKVTAQNSGQSPAENVVWNPTITYAALERSMSGTVSGNWRKTDGIDMPAGAVLPLIGVSVPNMSLAAFATLDENKIAPRVDVTVVVNFRYQDVFGRAIENSATYQGVARQDKMEAMKPDARKYRWIARMSLVSNASSEEHLADEKPES